MSDAIQPANDEATPAPTPPLYSVVVETAELNVKNDGPPMFEFEITGPANPIFVYGIVRKQEQIVHGGPPPKGLLVPRIAFETHAGQPKVRKRFALLQAGDQIDVFKADEAPKYVGCFVHPMTMMPIAVFELTPSPAATTLEDLSKAAVGVDEFIAATQPQS